MWLYGLRYPGWVWHMVASAHLSLNVNQRLRIATLLAGINRYVLSPQMKKPRTMARLLIWSTIEAMATISDLHEIYAFQFGFARLASKFVAFCCERDRVTDMSASLSSLTKLLRNASQ